MPAYRFTRRRRLLGVILLGACRSIVDPALPHGAQAFAPPAVYRTWWTMTESCSGRTGSFDQVHWYRVPGVDELPSSGPKLVTGYWSLASDQIVLAGNGQFDGGLVRHEMLHALLRSGGHPRAAFLGTCAGVVDCASDCVTDAGPPPALDASALAVTEDELALSVSVAPAAPSMAIDDGFFTVTVSATNARERPVVVSLRDSSRAILGQWLQFHLQSARGGISSGVNAIDASTVRFAPGETKRQVFDFHIGNDIPSGALPLGTWSVGGGLGLRNWVYDTVTLKQE